jgi:transcriptional regulator with XRE-family HTH domain
MTTTDMPQKIHEGRNVRRFREMLGMKQDALAYELGEDWTQKKISQLEQKETIDADILEQVAKVLKVPVEAIKNLNDEGAINIIANTFTNHDHSSPQFASTIYNTPTFNPLDKVVELYERLLQVEREKNEILQGNKGE